MSEMAVCPSVSQTRELW